jgi:uncharacterized protein
MFGFGFGKLIVLVAVVAAVWYGFKLVSRLEQQRKRRVKEQGKQDADSVGKMEKCPVCDTYVVAADAQNCGRDGCPY